MILGEIQNAVALQHILKCGERFIYSFSKLIAYYI